MVFWMIVMAANLVVGAFVGLTGVAGFLLPIVYTGPLGMGVTEGLALSFAAFIVSGALGSVNYNKAGNLDIPFGIRLSLGSLAGAVLGVRLNLIIPESTVKVILYVVVISDHLAATLILGFITGAVCSLSGAGGPVLVMPLLVVLGIGIRTAVGVALFNSVFIGIPACIGYMMQCSVKDLLPVMAAALVFHGIGVVYGSRNAVKINQILLKKGIAVFSILIAIWKLAL